MKGFAAQISMHCCCSRGHLLLELLFSWRSYRLFIRYASWVSLWGACVSQIYLDDTRYYLREGISGNYLVLYVIMENCVFVIIVNYIYTDPDTIKTIKISKLRWTGHIMWMPEENPANKLTLLRPGGSRRADRPKLRWLDRVEEELRTLGIRS